MNINISISSSGFPQKPNQEEIKKIEYKRRILSLDQITDCIRNGYVLSANFTSDYESIFRQSQRSHENLIGTPFIMLDLDDDIKCSLGELVDKLELKPTIAYTTYSHKQEGKGNRYRLMFFFNEEIFNINLAKELYLKIVDINKLSISDNCGKNCAQAVFGSHSECELINTNLIHSISEFQLENQNGHSNSIREEEENNIELECPILDKEYISDYWNMSYTDLIAKYNDKYCFFQHTPIEAVSDDIPYIILPSDYVEIKRYWIYTTNHYENGEIRNITSKARKIKDGEGRKKKLYLNGILRRLMVEHLQVDHLLHCLVNELYHYIDNSEDKINKKQLLGIAIHSYNADLEKYKSLNKIKDKRKFVVNGEYCLKHGLNKKQVRNLSKKIITTNRIGELFDVSLTEKANIEMFKENGLTISTKTLQRFRKEMGITKNQKGNGHSNSIKEEERNNIEIESLVQYNFDNLFCDYCGHSTFIREEEENNIEIESPVLNDLDKPYYDYQCKLLLSELDEDVSDGYYDMKDSDDIKGMTKTFIRRAKQIYPNYNNKELIDMFKEHYKLAS